jgi:hypothetical protein
MEKQQQRHERMGLKVPMEIEIIWSGGGGGTSRPYSSIRPSAGVGTLHR